MKYLLTLFMSLLSCLLVAQNVIVEHYSKNQGLLNNMVSMTEKDSDGFMWFATWYGLCRFDGERYLHITITNWIMMCLLGRYNISLMMPKASFG